MWLLMYFIPVQMLHTGSIEVWSAYLYVMQRYKSGHTDAYTYEINTTASWSE